MAWIPKTKEQPAERRLRKLSWIRQALGRHAAAGAGEKGAGTSQAG